MDLSIVVPLLNEELCLDDLYAEIVEAVTPLGLEWEVVFVDDGSRDGSYAVCEKLFGRDPEHLQVLSFRRNLGKAAALAEGFARARGAVIVTMDADLQDVPAEIPRLLAKLDEGFDLVSGWKVKRQDPLSKTLPSLLFNRVTAWVTGIDIHDFNCGLKAYRREVTEAIQVYGELHRYLPVLAHWQGFRVGEIEVRHRARERGKTKYGMNRFLNGFLDLLTVTLLTRYDRKPLHLFGGIGALLLAAGGACLVYLVGGWFMGHWIGDRPLLPLSILITLTGFQFLLFGLLAELIAARRGDERQPVWRALGSGRDGAEVAREL
jgi:glycosyltransferase involved in cell wall biosynthesis